MKKGVIYARFSSDKQTEQSIEGQLSVCQDFCTAQGITVVGIYIDRAMTGRNDDRPDFQRMLRDSAGSGWDYVIVYKGDRFARNRFDSAINKNILKQNGVRVLSATENIPDTPEGIVLEAILEGYAEYYSAELSQKIRRGMNENRKKRNSRGGRTPYGYNVVNKKYVINEAEAEIVRRVFNAYANGAAMQEICDALNAEGHRTKLGGEFTCNTVLRMLHLSLYIGHYEFEGVEFPDTYPRIVDDDVWHRVQGILGAHRRTKTRRRVTDFLLAKKAFCGVCGARMKGVSGTSKTGEEYFYYKCANATKKSHTCKEKPIRKGELEDIVYYACCDVLDGGAIHYLAERIYAVTTEAFTASPMLDSFKAKLKEKEKALSNLYKAVMDGLTTDGIKQLIADTEREISDLKVRIIEEERKSKVHFTVEQFEQFLSRLSDEQASNPEFRRQLIYMLVRSVTVYPDRVKITFYFSPDGGKDYESETDLPEEPLWGDSSALDALAPPKKDNSNTVIYFVTKFYWGVWVKREKAR